MNAHFFRSVLYAAAFAAALIHHGVAQFKPAVAWPVGREAGSQRHLIGDFNGDGIADELNKTSTAWRVGLSKGNAFAPETQWAGSILSDADQWFAGDFNGDGQCDLAGFHAPTGDWMVAMTGQSRTDGSGAYHFAEPVKWPLIQARGSAGQWIGDFNGDGLSDVLFVKDNRWNVAVSNGKGFEEPRTWGTISLAEADQWYAADVDGDGRCDLVGFTPSTGMVTVARTDDAGSAFQLPLLRNPMKNIHGAERILIGDCNADGKSDIIIPLPRGIWRVAKWRSKSFDNAATWASGLFATGSQAEVVAGDFNGDGYCDVAQFDSAGGAWKIGLNGSPKKRIVAAWYTMWYTTSDTSNGRNFWNHVKRDAAKIPIAGEGTDTASGIYNSTDRKVIRRQINAMRKNGIDVIIVDFTNGFYQTTNAEINRLHQATDALFQVMSSFRSEKKALKIAIALGYEFWGPRATGDSSFWANGGWKAKTAQQKAAFNRLQHEYVDRYGDIYFRYRGRPLVPIFIGDGTDNPPINQDGSSYPLWHDNRFTLKNVVAWASTWSYVQGGAAHYFHNGLDNNYNGWGWGSLYGGTSGFGHKYPDIPVFDRTPPLPYSAECMSIMPGTYNWWNKQIVSYVLRSKRNDEKSSGDYYIKSWTEVIRNMPVIAMIADWNNWNEETAIEASNSWRDYYGHVQSDWYLQITKAYSSIFHSQRLPDGVYVRDEQSSAIYKYTAPNRWSVQTQEPARKPVIVLPAGWIRLHYPHAPLK